MSARCLHAHPLVGVPAGAASPRAAAPYAVLGSVHAAARMRRSDRRTKLLKLK